MGTSATITEQPTLPLYACVCSGEGETIIKTVSTYECGIVHQISCGCGRGVHGRTLEQAKELWDIVQLRLHNNAYYKKMEDEDDE